MLIMTLGLVGCGAGGGAAATGGGSPGSSIPAVTSHIYRYDVTGSGLTFAMDIFTWDGANETGAQHEMTLSGPTFMYTIPDANPVQYTPTAGLSSLAQFALNGGSGTLSVDQYRDGVLISTRSTSMVGTSINFPLVN